jgi:lipid-binding SYLF domain-containing protein
MLLDVRVISVASAPTSGAFGPCAATSREEAIMNTTSRKVWLSILSTAVMAFLALAGPGHVFASHLSAADNTIKQYKKTDPNLARFFDRSVGYAVFPTIGKGGAGVGAAYGAGVLYEKGKAVGKASLTQVTVGLQLGGQTYSEIIFFETEQALSAFKRNQFAFSAQLSAVALKSGASANARFSDGVAVFTAAKDGFMLETSVGGQRFGYKPYPGPAPSRASGGRDSSEEALALLDAARRV